MQAKVPARTSFYSLKIIFKFSFHHFFRRKNDFSAQNFRNAHCLSVPECETCDFVDTVDSDEEERIRVINADHLSVKRSANPALVSNDLLWQEVELVFVSGAENDVINGTRRVVIEGCAVSAH